MNENSEHLYPWIRLMVNDLSVHLCCERCGKTRGLPRDSDAKKVKREGYDFTLRHRHCPEKKIVLQ